MFGLCESMKWNHLPEAGGIYAQNPELLDGFRTIFSIRAKYEAEKEKKDEADRDRQMRQSKAKGGR